jgi:diguanylate cyclase (GGDEF)-like protein/PAS domain S-box-containing protein
LIKKTAIDLPLYGGGNMEHSFELAASMLNYVSDIIWMKDINGHYIIVSDSFNTLYGLPPKYVIGKTDFDFHPAEQAIEYRKQDQIVCEQRLITASKDSQLAADGEKRFFEVNRLPVCDAAGRVIGLIGIGRDITSQVRIREYLKYFSYYDPLTGLYNRNYFEEMPYKLHKRQVQVAGVLVCDIDNLKLVNDIIGRDAGDQWLKAASNIIKSAVSQQGIVVRTGGDEFAGIIFNATPEIMHSIIQSIRQQLKEERKQHNLLPFNMAIGHVVGDLSQNDFFSLVKRAEAGMYQEKMRHIQLISSNLLKTVISPLFMQDTSLSRHCERMQHTAACLGAALGFTEEGINHLRLLAQFHDIGKILIPETILEKPGPLSADEWAIMHRHPETGFHLAKLTVELAPVADWILKHHEWWNGAGYPLGLAGLDIPLEARIIHIVDAYDAMTHDRSYRKAISPTAAAKELQALAGIEFDPDLVKRFVELIGCEL